MNMIYGNPYVDYWYDASWLSFTNGYKNIPSAPSAADVEGCAGKKQTFMYKAQIITSCVTHLGKWKD